MKGVFNQHAGEAWNRLERDILVNAFEHCRNNQVETARMLGISRNVFRSMLSRYGLLGSGSNCGLRSEPTFLIRQRPWQQ